METTGTKHVVISVGGSLIVPNEVDVVFLKHFTELIISLVHEGYTFTLFTGGGSLCRTYNKAVETFRTITTEEKDWLGISITRVNATLLKTIFGDLAHDEIIIDPNVVLTTNKPITIGGGWKPGWSTDYDAVLYAKKIGVSSVINISNIDYVYTKDPKTNPDAEKLETVAWNDYLMLIPGTWEAGLHSPFDPLASRFAKESGITVKMLNGNKTEELKKAIIGDTFTGTHIHA